MGQTLSRKPISQRQSFPTLNTASSPFTGDLSQFQGYTTPTPAPAQDPQDAQMPTGFQSPSVLGGGYGNEGFARFRMQRMMDM